jgi:hypothetical protein
MCRQGVEKIHICIFPESQFFSIRAEASCIPEPKVLVIRSQDAKLGRNSEPLLYRDDNTVSLRSIQELWRLLDEKMELAEITHLVQIRQVAIGSC